MTPARLDSVGVRRSSASLLCLGCLLALHGRLSAQDTTVPSTPPPPAPGVSLEDGFTSSHPLLAPGKLDFLYRVSEDVINYNAFAWTPIFKGGAGVLDFDGGVKTEYFGGYARPLQAWEGLGELIVGGGGVAVENAAGEDDLDWEVQGEYRLPFGAGIGGGVVDHETSGIDINFGKVTYRGALWDWKYIVAGLVQEFEDDTDVGGYGAVYNDVVMAVYGHDGEQWRATFGFIFPENESLLRPAAEVLYVDNTTGSFNGPRFLFINATLAFKGGFLSHPARLGRAMGPQGLEYGNPLGFLRPTWNRRLDVWELGRVADFRAVYTDLPGGVELEEYELLTYPFEYLGEAPAPLRNVFVGGFYANDDVDDTPGILGGYSGKALFATLSLQVRYATEADEVSGVVGLIDWF